MKEMNEMSEWVWEASEIDLKENGNFQNAFFYNSYFIENWTSD